MSDLDANRLRRTFSALAAAGKKTLVPFVSAGYPDLQTTGLLLSDFERRGVRVCELGIPFSDPIADGPVIQASYTEALAAGITSEKIFDAVGGYRAGGGKLGLVAMVSYSIVYRHGVAEYFDAAARAGFDAMLIPDLSLEEAGTVEQLASDRSLCNVMLIAPNTSPERQLQIASHSSGFIYFMSIAGITGERDGVAATTIQAVGELRRHTDTPICVGFGIGDPQTVQAACKTADGAIVGTAIVRRITDHKDQPREKLVQAIGDFVGELLEPVK